MTRRVAAGLGRLLSPVLIVAALAIVLAAALFAACGGSNGGDSPQPTATVTATASATASPSLSPSPSPSQSAAALGPVTLYFVRDGSLCAVERRLPRTVAPAKASLNALFKGPTAAERSAGVSTAEAGGVKLNSITIRDGLATVDVSSRWLKSAGDPQGAPTAQIVYTLTRYPTVREVGIRVDGEPYPADSPSTVWTRRDFRALEPAIFVEQPGLGAVVSSPFTLRGTASVFEATFQARLIDSSDRRIVSVTVQASRGAPGRGSFSKKVAFSTSAARGTLIVYSVSMEDGSRQYEVRIPVTFAGD